MLQSLRAVEKEPLGSLTLPLSCGQALGLDAGHMGTKTAMYSVTPGTTLRLPCNIQMAQVVLSLMPHEKHVGAGEGSLGDQESEKQGLTGLSGKENRK